MTSPSAGALLCTAEGPGHHGAPPSSVKRSEQPATGTHFHRESQFRSWKVKRLIDLRDLLTRRRPGPGVVAVRILLRVISLPYGWVIRVRNLLYDLGLKKIHACELPVISVGNLTVGGTGKSPVVAWLARWLRERNLRVAVLSRGYGQLAEGQNDEALELELLHPDVPHLQHWDRVASARLAQEELDMQVLLLDDAFQHRRMSRNLDVALMDATDPPSARWMLPGGLLREPLSGLRRADVILLTRVDQARPEDRAQLDRLIRRKAPQAVVVETCHRPSGLHVYPDQSRSLDVLRDLSILAFCGIGNPVSFFRSLERLGADVLDCRTWPDHHGYNQADLDSLSAWCQAFPNAGMLVCTMKDWVKLQTPTIGNVTLGALKIELEVGKGQRAWEDQLAGVLSPVNPPPS